MTQYETLHFSSYFLLKGSAHANRETLENVDIFQLWTALLQKLVTVGESFSAFAGGALCSSLGLSDMLFENAPHNKVWILFVFPWSKSY